MGVRVEHELRDGEPLRGGLDAVSATGVVIQLD
jgi:hypothetical protein